MAQRKGRKLCVSSFGEQLVEVEGQGLRVLTGILNYVSRMPTSRVRTGTTTRGRGKGRRSTRVGRGQTVAQKRARQDASPAGLGGTAEGAVAETFLHTNQAEGQDGQVLAGQAIAQSDGTPQGAWDQLATEAEITLTTRAAPGIGTTLHSGQDEAGAYEGTGVAIRPSPGSLGRETLTAATTESTLEELLREGHGQGGGGPHLPQCSAMRLGLFFRDSNAARG